MLDGAGLQKPRLPELVEIEADDFESVEAADGFVAGAVGEEGAAGYELDGGVAIPPVGVGFDVDGCGP